MVNWLKFLESGYDCNFVSPYSVEICKQILYVHSRKGYFQYNTKDFLSRHRKPYFLFVDVNQVAPDSYDFRIEKDFRWGKKKSYPLTIIGHLDRLPNGTHVIYRVNADDRGIITLLINGLLFFMWLVVFTQSLKSSITAPLQVLLFGIQPIIWMSILWWVRMRPIRQFLEAPQRWLNGEERSMTDEALYATRQPLKSRFDFYTPDSISVCIEKLKQGSLTNHYQDSALGMVAGTGINGDIFMTFQEETPNRHYFFAERNMWLSYHSPYDSPARVIGILEIEDDMTHVHGYSYFPSGWAYIGGYGMISVVTLGIALWLYIPALLIAMGIGLVGYTMIMTRMNRFHAYPAMTILDIHPSKHKLRLLRTSYEFDFHSPYPIEDCVNMLLNYTPIPSEYPTPWGIGKGGITEDGLQVVLYEQDVNQYQLLIQSSKNNFGNTAIQIIGTLQTEGYGVRVRGKVNSKSSKSLLWLTLIMVGISVVSILGLPGSNLPFVLMALLVPTYITSIRQIRKVGSYPQQVLGAKSSRKRKLADTAEFE
ncbi:MAG: hypothetical protein SFZ02_03985 [bacterium]|nr:hypothetical protein [bacterium]